MRRRLGLKAQMRRWNDLTRQIRRAAEESRPKCGCAVNAPEADASKWPCPCGSHCRECK
jgi:hypothetical protein